MEHKDDEQPLSSDAEQLHSLEHSTVPPSLLPSVLSHLGLGDMPSLLIIGVDEQLAALSDEEIPVRVAAVRSLGQHKETRTIGSLVTALNDPAWEVRAAATWALGEFGKQAPLETLIRATHDEDGLVRAAALRTLGLLGDRMAIEPLVQALDDTDWQAREIAVLTLGEFGEQAPLEPLLARLNDEHAAVREAARMALEQSHPEALAAFSGNPFVITQEPGNATVFSAGEQEQPWAGVEVEARAKVSSNGDSTLIQFTTHVKMLLLRVVRDVVGTLPGGQVSRFIEGPPLADTPSTLTDDESSDVIAGERGEADAWRQSVQTRPHRLRRITEGVLAALIIIGLAVSWLTIEHRLHRSQGAATTYLLAYHGYANGPAVWSSDSQYISFPADPTPAGETALVWQRATGQLTKHQLHMLLAQAQEHKIVFAPDGKYLAFVERDASNKEAVQVWDIVAWRRILTTTSLYSSLNVLWSPNSTRIVIPSEDGTMQVWNIVTGHEQMICHVPPVLYMAESSLISPDGLNVLYGYSSQNLYILDLTTCKLLILPPNGSSVLAWSPQGNRFATLSFTDANLVQLWDAQTGHNLWSMHLTAPATNIVWTPDGTRIVISGDKEVKVVDVATKRIVLQVTPTRSTVRFQLARAVWALSPDGARLASLSGANTVQLWDAVTGDKLQKYQNQGGSVNVVAWSPDSRSIATGSIDGTVQAWSGNTGSGIYHGDSSTVLNIVWSPDGKFIAAGGLDGSMWAWQVN
jgi:WD40 repeat protein